MYRDVSGFQRNASPGISSRWFCFWLIVAIVIGCWQGYRNGFESGQQSEAITVETHLKDFHPAIYRQWLDNDFDW
jgi:hypothetical protein